MVATDGFKARPEELVPVPHGSRDGRAGFDEADTAGEPEGSDSLELHECRGQSTELEGHGQDRLGARLP